MIPRVSTLTVSDTRTLEDDASGRALREELRELDLTTPHRIVPDDAERIAAAVREAVESGADAVVLTGGTGLAPRDVTYEAVAPLFDKTLDGFGEAFRRLSWDQIGARAILSRATAGTIGRCLVFALPGSEKAVRLAARSLILPVLGHAVDLLAGRTHHK